MFDCTCLSLFSVTIGNETAQNLDDRLTHTSMSVSLWSVYGQRYACDFRYPLS